MRVLLRNPRASSRSTARCAVGTLLDRLDVNRESVLVIVGDTLVPGDAVLADADTVEIRPVISGGADVKCTVCKEPAVIDIRRHNANFCAEHFLRLCRDQVAKAIKDFDMLAPDDRVLVAVSGGKDSPGGVGHPARARLRGRRPLPRARHRRLQRRQHGGRGRLRRRRVASRCTRSTCPRDHGFDIPTGAKAARRVPCSACGLSKRHLFDEAALDGGYDVVVTGHNLDDEAAVLFGNVLHWQTDYLGRQLPVLPARDGFPRKVKPLVRLGEREMAAYCVLRGIDYIVEECPMAAGNKHLGYKEALNAIEATSPGTKHDFYFGFLARASDRFTARGGRGPGAAAGLRGVRRADHRRGVRLLPAGRARADAEPVPVELLRKGGRRGCASEPAVRRRASRCCSST